MGVSSRWLVGRYGGGVGLSRWLDVEPSALATSVAVMAPALTEGGPQKPENLLSPLTAAGFLSAEQASQVCKNREVLAQFVVSANVQPSQIDEQCLRGIPKDLIRDVINFKFGNCGLENLSNLILTKERKKDLHASSTAIMNDDSSMGDPSADSSMGFLKSIMGAGSLIEESCHDINDIDQEVAKLHAANNKVINEKQQTEDDRSFEQIMGFDSSDIVTNNQDLSQNVDEILQVIKSIESAAKPSNSSVPEGDSEIFSGFSFERDLLNAVDVMGLCNDNMTENAQEQNANKLAEQVSNNQVKVETKQKEQEEKCASLLKRLRKLQCRWLGQHISEESLSVLELAQKSAKKGFIQDLESLGPKAGNVRNYPELGGTLNSFLQKVEKSSIAQNNSLAVRQRNCFRYFGAGSKDNYMPTNNRQSIFGVPQIKLNNEEVENVAGPLATKLKIVQSGYDSDCTASSSGGESCDEMQTFNNPHQQQLPIKKRASWRYAQERASIAARWTWLSAQISDLEFKIHHHTDLLRQIRANKGAVTLEVPETVNGYSGVLPGSTTRCDTELPASRTRPFSWSTYRKRKLIQLDRLHEISKKAARPATLMCDCDGSLAPCALCTGRRDPMQPQESFEQLSVYERVALTDPGFHPVLSLPDEINHTAHLDAIMRSTEWQQKILRSSMRVPRIKETDSNERRNKKQTDYSAKYPARLKKSSSSLVTAKIKRKVLKGKSSRTSQDKNNQNVNRKRVSRTSHVEDDEEASMISSSSKHSSPVPSPLQSSTMQTSAEKITLREKSSSSHSRIRQNSYDIDNIVIPYSVAAATRLEKLQYKEILIPKWRICEDLSKVEVKNGTLDRPNQDSDFEDISDETIIQRHDRSEKEENKRFLSFLNTPYQLRMRQNRRADSRADSGTNTPDPMSPHASECGGDTMSPLTSPPATPNMQESENSQSNSLQITLRRRTLASVIRMQKDEPANVINDEEHENILPYEPRSFPLSDEVYDKMLEVMPEGHWQNSSLSMCSQDEEKIHDIELESQVSDSTESALCDMDPEDPNDPEWTVAEEKEIEKERIRPTAKR